jgi:hypothetical protein
LARKQYIDANYDGTVNDVFGALVATIAFRRWAPLTASVLGPLPVAGWRYRCQAGSVLRQGRVVEVIRPVAITLKEVLHDPPCRVALTLRWRVDSTATGSCVRLRAEYRLNHAAVLRARHWDHRLATHFQRQFTFLGNGLTSLHNARPASGQPAENRDLVQQ